jgi:hypothetical protein
MEKKTKSEAGADFCKAVELALIDGSQLSAAQTMQTHAHWMSFVPVDGGSHRQAHGESNGHGRVPASGLRVHFSKLNVQCLF